MSQMFFQLNQELKFYSFIHFIQVVKLREKEYGYAIKLIIT